MSDGRQMGASLVSDGCRMGVGWVSGAAGLRPKQGQGHRARMRITKVASGHGGLHCAVPYAA